MTCVHIVKSVPTNFSIIFKKCHFRNKKQKTKKKAKKKTNKMKRKAKKKEVVGVAKNHSSSLWVWLNYLLKPLEVVRTFPKRWPLR